MQSQPIELSTEISYFAAPESPDTTNQYGLLSNQSPLPDRTGLYGVDESADTSSTSRDGIDASDGSLAEGNGDNRRLKGAGSHGKRPRPSAQLIAEYENAMLPAKQKRNKEGPEFKIVKRKLAPAADAARLEDFPNEVLTHILSHLPATSLSAVSLVSRRFYSLVTTPHAWRAAFSRFFPGQDALQESLSPDEEEHEQFLSEQRFFTRLTGLASWRSEYILRTRLLRSLSCGKPAQIAPGHGASSRAISAANNVNPVVTYTSQLFSTIDHLHASFGTGKKSLRFIHGTQETGASGTSDPNVGKVDAWGLSDPQALPQFVDLFPGSEEYGLGIGEVVGAPNVMDVSQPYGMVYGEGFPGGKMFFRSPEEMRGRFLACSEVPSDPAAGIPRLLGASEAVCAIWIARSNNVPLNTERLVGMLSGSSLGAVTSYSLGSDNIGASRIDRGEITAKWVLSPGVPIIGIKVDDSYSAKRKSNGRIWAFAVNALGEVFYLNQVPERPVIDRAAKISSPKTLEKLAWETGRSVHWKLVEPTRRIAHEDPYNDSEIDGSYSPRSSYTGMKLSREALMAETAEIEKYLRYTPAHFRKVCDGWDMRRRLEVDFAGDDGHGAGEAVFVIRCGHEEKEDAEIKRFMRCRSEQASREEYPVPKTPPMAPNTPTMASLFGGGDLGSGDLTESQDANSPFLSPEGSTTPASKTSNSSSLAEEWYISILSLEDQPCAEITTSAVDASLFALTTTWEDPLLTIGGRSSTSSPLDTPPIRDEECSAHKIPGRRGRFLAVGTKTGSVLLWNMRGPHSENPSIVNELHSLRTIHTDSPQTSCLAVSALYVVHGGNDGLVQTWDPLASSLQPIRTLNSRFSSRARRRLVQAEASVQGVGINLYAAGAIIMDPDPTVLRGMVSLGTHLRYWSYSSSSADQYSSKKSRLRRSCERGSNSGPDRFTPTGRGALMDYIANEQHDLKLEKERKAKEEAHLRGRFGVGIGGMTDEEALLYAEMVSQEAFLKEDEQRRMISISPIDPLEGGSRAPWTSGAASPEESESMTSIPNDSTPHQTATGPRYKSEAELEQEIEEAIRLSLMNEVNDDNHPSPEDLGRGQYEVEIKYKSKSKNNSPNESSRSDSSGSFHGTVVAGKKASRRQRGGAKAKFEPLENGDVRADDLELALRLSLMDVQGADDGVGEDGDEDGAFPALEGRDISGKGKGKGRAL